VQGVSFTAADRFSGDFAVRFAVPGRQGGTAAFLVMTAPTPTLGQYRFVRFAWKQTGGTYARIDFIADGNIVDGYLAGKTHPDQFVKLSEAPPRQWTEVTRDLFADRLGNYVGTGEIKLNGLRIETDGELLLDGVWVGRSLRDLDRLQPRNLD
jgi:hypothetical protein